MLEINKIKFTVMRWTRIHYIIYWDFGPYVRILSTLIKLRWEIKIHKKKRTSTLELCALILCVMKIKPINGKITWGPLIAPVGGCGPCFGIWRTHRVVDQESFKICDEYERQTNWQVPSTLPYVPASHRIIGSDLN